MQETRYGIDKQRENDGVESKRENAVDQSEAAHPARGDLHVRHLSGHPDHKRKVGEIKIIRRPIRPIAREDQTTGMVVHARHVAVAIKRMGIPQTEYRMNQRPRRRDG